MNDLYRLIRDKPLLGRCRAQSSDGRADSLVVFTHTGHTPVPMGTCVECERAVPLAAGRHGLAGRLTTGCLQSWPCFNDSFSALMMP